jgi:hypothetical protein
MSAPDKSLAILIVPVHPDQSLSFAQGAEVLAYGCTTLPNVLAGVRHHHADLRAWDSPLVWHQQVLQIEGRRSYTK